MFYLQEENGILKLFRKNSKENIYADFLDGEFQFRLKTLKKSQPLMKAIGVEPGLKILDATAGLGRDALSFCYFGAHVTAVEENEMVYRLFDDGLKRAFLNPKFKDKFDGKIELIHQSSLDLLKKNTLRPDVVYLDPMYPLTEKSAKPKKEMAFLRELLPVTENLEEILRLSIRVAQKRVVLKRPLDSDFLLKTPSHSFKGKMVRFDMYLV